ncbi:arylsulfatase [Pseudomonas laurylsulfatiphila]|uniref:arylsulfatase n=1 Tax=Pseudomonas laurylsulfatiphila TaxID=2011015 RepID=UPI00215EC640|nr:arylsulfatase [Pseudomonas laurylsulfatiphila]UVM02397.1 arylsulfatase [Pseudomonas laurylsulfatiphila]
MIPLKPLVLAMGCLAFGTHAFATPKRPNIVVLVADDWGYSDVGAFGSEIATPNIDTLAREGVRFSDFHVTASCSPTRSMLLTGVDNHRNGVGNMPETMPDEHLGKPGYSGVLNDNDNAITVASLLKDSGYNTYITGKWHLGKTPDTLPDKRGFERSFIQADSGSDNWEERPYAPLYDKAAWFENGQPAHLPKDYYSSTFIVDKAMDYIAADRQGGKPFFAYLGFQANHVPVQAPKDMIDKYRGRYDQGWTALRQARRDRAVELGLIPAGAGLQTMASTADWNALDAHEKRYEARRMEVYAAMAETMDQQIGRFIEHLKASGEYDNTVFVFLSDNGSEPTDPYAIPAIRLWLEMNYTREFDRLGSKGAFTSIGPSWASAAASPFSGYKFFAGEGGLRTPMIVSGVPGIQANHIAKSFTHVTDIVPTLLEVAGVPAHHGEYQGRAVEPLIGSSLVPVLQGTAERVHPQDQAIGYELSGSAALFKGDYKLVKSLKPVGNEQWHLYNIVTDPGETIDLQAQMPERFQRMQADYAEYARANGVLPMPVGYDYMHQGQMYALKHVVIPKLKAMAPPLAAVILLLAGVLVWRRRRKQGV